MIAYDISDDERSDVKNEMMTEKGYEDFLNVKGKIHNLPESTLWHRNKSSPQEAIDDLEKVVYDLNEERNESNKISLTRCVSCEFINHSSIPSYG